MNNKIKRIAGLGILSALVIVLQLFASQIKIGTVSINLSLIPIVIGAILYGPYGGLFLGLLNGFLNAIDPNTQYFMTYNAFFTIVLCFLKTGIAGLVSGFIYKLLKNKTVGIIIASIAVPIINTLIFFIGTMTVFYPLIHSSQNNVFEYVIIGMIGFNFLVELLINVVLSPSIIKIINLTNKK